MEKGSLRYVTNNTDECEPEQIFSIPRGQFCIDQVHVPLVARYAWEGVVEQKKQSYASVTLMDKGISVVLMVRDAGAPFSSQLYWCIYVDKDVCHCLFQE